MELPEVLGLLHFQPKELELSMSFQSLKMEVRLSGNYSVVQHAGVGTKAVLRARTCSHGRCLVFLHEKVSAS